MYTIVNVIIWGCFTLFVLYNCYNMGKVRVFQNLREALDKVETTKLKHERGMTLEEMFVVGCILKGKALFIEEIKKEYGKSQTD